MMQKKASKAQHRRITDILKRRVLRGQFAAGGRLPSENELLKEFKVSKHTLLKALDALLNQGLIIRKQGSGTFVAPSVSAQGNRRIAVIVYHSDSPYYSKVIKGIESYAARKGFGMILCNSRGDMASESNYVERFIDEVDGFIICPTEEKSSYSAGVRNLFDSEVPMVLISNTAVNQLTMLSNYVIPDNCTGGFLAGKHLVDCGYQKIGILVCEDLEKETIRERLKGFKLALLQNGIVFDETMLMDASSDDPEHGYLQNGYNSAAAVLRFAGSVSCGIFAVGDSLAIGLFKGLKELGGCIPGRIGICGFDDIEPASQWDISLTTVAQDAEQIGKIAAEIIIDEVAKGEENRLPRHVVVPVELKIRKTTAFLPR